MSDGGFRADPSIYSGEDPAAPVAAEAERPVGGIAAGLAGAEQASFVAPRPLRADVWRRFRQNRLAMAGLVFLVFLVLVAVFAPWIAPYGFDERTPGAFREGPSMDHLFGTDTIAAPSCDDSSTVRTPVSPGWESLPSHVWPHARSVSTEPSRSLSCQTRRPVCTLILPPNP